MISLSLLTGKANAQVANYTGSGGTSTTVTYYANESGTALTKTGFGTNSSCGSGGLSGMTMSTSITSYASGNPRVYYKVTPNAGYVLNVTGIQAICRSSGTGPTKARLAYSLDNGSTWTAEGSDHTQSTSGSCGASTNNFSWAGGISLPGITATNGIIVAVYPYSAGASGGTFQVNQLNVAGSVTASATCSGTPAAGSVSPAIASFCGSGSTTVTLSGASGGGGIAYQWQSSPDNATWSNISGATNVTCNTGSISATTYYRAATTCTVSALSATTSSTSVTINAIPTVAAITGPSVVNTGSTITLSSATSGGVWTSTGTATATIGSATGIVTGVAPGVTTISYAVTVSGCTGYATASISAVNAGTLATYIGTGGSSTSVIGIAGETVGALTATGFGTNGPCASGGLSGITVNTVHATYATSGPRVYFQILPATGNQLNVTGFSAITRESSTGPTKARLAYSLDGGTTWVDDATDHAQSTGGSCGASSNNFSWTSGLTVVGITSTTNGIIVAVYPYAPGASTGTFQVNRITINGTVTPAGSCTGATGGTAAAATSDFCGSGSTTMSVTGGTAGTGITYQWQDSPDGTTYTSISGATNATFVTPTLTATTNYQLVTTCSFGGTATSSAATVAINAIPSAGTITGVPSYIYIGTTETLSNATTGGTWSSSNVGVATIGSADGIVTGLIPGTTVVTYTVTSGTCTGTATAFASVLHPNTIAAYLGEDGNSVATTAFAGVSTTILNETGFGHNPACARGGISGLTNNAVHTFSTTNANVYFKVTANAGNYFDVTGFHATLRRSNSGIQKVRMAYSLDNGATWSDDGIDQAPDNAGCSFSSTGFSYSTSLPAGVNPASDGVIFALYPYDPIADGGTIQVNAIDITGQVNECPETAPINESNVVVCAGSTTTLTDETTGGTWSSSTPGVATVGSADGIVTGVSAGTATITYSVATPCGASFVTIVMSVNPTPSVDAITGNAPVCVGGNITLATTSTGGAWGSMDAAIAGVDGITGEVTGNEEGTVEIVYEIENEFGCIGRASAIVTVNICGGKSSPAAGVTAEAAAQVSLYPNPATATLNVASAEAVNVTIMSIDGKVMIEQKNAKSINVAGLTAGIYLVKIYDQNNMLVKTARFTKN